MSDTLVAPAPALAVAPGIMLPMDALPALSQNPKTLVLFSKPKIGKTTLLSKLGGCLLLDLEDGSDYVSAVKIKATTYTAMMQIVKKINEAGNPYKYLAVDTITALEEIVIPYAEYLYQQTPMGTKWFTETKLKYKSILNLPNGGGYLYLRLAFEAAIKALHSAAPVLILMGHLKDTILDKNGSDFTSSDLDLTGKLKRMVTSSADAIGYIYRVKNKNMITFASTDEVACGARPAHLRNQTFPISEFNDETGVYTSHWDKIFI
jgi:hypothetical protein